MLHSITWKLWMRNWAQFQCLIRYSSNVRLLVLFNYADVRVFSNDYQIIDFVCLISRMIHFSNYFSPTSIRMVSVVCVWNLTWLFEKKENRMHCTNFISIEPHFILNLHHELPVHGKTILFIIEKSVLSWTFDLISID